MASAAWTQAGVYIALWVWIKIVGAWVSPIRSALYLWMCVIIDTVCLTLQAVGGGLAAAATSNYEDPQTGTTIMVVGCVNDGPIRLESRLIMTV